MGFSFMPISFSVMAMAFSFMPMPISFMAMVYSIIMMAFSIFMDMNFLIAGNVFFAGYEEFRGAGAVIVSDDGVFQHSGSIFFNR